MRAVVIAGTLGVAALLSACTTIVIHSGTEVVSVERRLGFATVTLSPGVRGVAASTTGLGFVAGPLGFTVGYAKDSLVALSPTCQLILWPSDAQEIEQLRKLVGTLENVCLVDKE